MDVVSRADEWVIIHAGKTVARTFPSPNEAWNWADEFIDDQMFDAPNWLAPPLEYEPLPKTEA